jgi:hypothetical protein
MSDEPEEPEEQDKDEQNKKAAPPSVSELAAVGGRARAKKLTPEQRKEAARTAAEGRWEKDGRRLPRATHEGELSLGGVILRCAVLEDGRRVITQSDVMRALGRARQAKGRAHYDSDVNLPAFLTAKNLKPFISKELEVTSSQIKFRPLKGGMAFGYPAELLPKVCDVFLEAEERGDVLLPSQTHIATRAKILMRALAHVGIVALVDEATNYQEIRDRLALQEILDKFLRKELAAWAKRFPDEFYQEIFRLRRWPWKGMAVNRPQAVGKFTKDLVYMRLAPNILSQLEARNPTGEGGQRKSKHHQWLTEDVGHPALARHLYAVIALMRTCDTWDQFKTLLNRAFPKYSQNLLLPFMGGENETI